VSSSKPATRTKAKTVARKTAATPAGTTAEVVKPATRPRPARKSVTPKTAEPPLAERPAAPTGAERYRWIAHAAYLRAERRSFVPGKEIEDWLAAEAAFIAAFGLDSAA